MFFYLLGVSYLFGHLFKTIVVCFFRFGHSSVCLQNGDVVIIGGFGVSDRSDTHGRLNDVVLFRSSSTGGASTCRSLASFGELPGQFS